MPMNKSMAKRMRQAQRRAERNKAVRTRTRSTLRIARESIAEGADSMVADVGAAQKALDKAAKRRIVHPNAAARRKSRLMKRLAAKTSS